MKMFLSLGYLAWLVDNMLSGPVTARLSWLISFILFGDTRTRRECCGKRHPLTFW